MGFEIEKTAEENQQKIINNNVVENSTENVNDFDTKLTNAENEYLTYNLSGEAQAQGFTEYDGEQLLNGLSGNNQYNQEQFVKSDNNILNAENFSNIEASSADTQVNQQDSPASEILDYDNTAVLSDIDNNNNEYLPFKQYIANIKSVTNQEELLIIQNQINNTPYSQAEKEVLKNECIKQQGIIQNSELKNNYGLTKSNQENTEIKENPVPAFDEERQKSAASFELSKFCTNSSQREFVRFILGDKRLFLCVNKQTLKLFEKLISGCQNKEFLNAKISFLKKALENNRFYAQNETLSENILSCTANITPENIEKNITVLESYKQENHNISAKTFCELLNKSNDNTEDSKFAKQILDFAVKKIFNKNNSKSMPADELIQYGMANNASNEELTDAYNTLSGESDSEILTELAENNFENRETENFTENVIQHFVNNDIELYKNFVTGRKYDEKLLNGLLKNAQKNYCKDLLEDMCVNQQYSAENIVSIADLTTETTVGVTRKVLTRNDVTADEKVAILSAINKSQDQISLIESVLNKDDLNIKSLPKILDSAKLLKLYKADRCDNLNPKKMDIYVSLLQNPKTSPDVRKLIDFGYDIETISNFNPYMFKELIDKHEKKTTTNDADKKFFFELGFNENETNSIINAITKNNILNTEIKNIAVELFNKGIPTHQIGDILNSSTITGEYNSKIAADTISILNMGLNTYLERYIPIINNLSENEIYKLYSNKFKSDLKASITNIPHEKIPALRAKGFDIDGILYKLSYKKPDDKKNSPINKDNQHKKADIEKQLEYKKKLKEKNKHKK